MSWIEPTLAEQALLRRVDSVEGAAIVGHKGTGDYTGIVFPYVLPGEDHIREYRLWITGGDRVRARRYYENSSEFDPTHKVWLATNHKPVIPANDPAMSSRLKMVPFAAVSFEDREDKTLKQSLHAELPGILVWAVEGCLQWQHEGLGIPESVLRATSQYRQESDQVARFVEECCTLGKSLQARARAVYNCYRKWVKATGEEILTEKSFGTRLGERFLKEHKQTGTFYKGIGLRRAPTDGY
jgi:putative DNA primase/helicase